MEEQKSGIQVRFVSWLIQNYGETEEHHNAHYNFIRKSSLNTDTVRRWRIGEQKPTIYSIEKTINEYAKYMAEEDFAEDEINVYRDALIEITGLAEYIKELNKESENKDAVIEKLQDANRKLRRRLKNK